MKSSKEIVNDIEWRLKNDIFFFIKVNYGMEAQPCFPKYRNVKPIDWTADMFGTKKIIPFQDTFVIDYDWYCFIKDKHISWQQAKVFALIQEELDRCNTTGDRFKLQLAITSARGIGKTWIEAVATLFFMCRGVEVGGIALSPTGDNSKGTVWAGLDTWMMKTHPEVLEIAMPGCPLIKTDDAIFRRSEKVSNQYKFTRRTTNKDNLNSIAGYHAPFIIYTFDEAAGIYDDIIDTLLYGFNAYEERFVIMISNPRRTAGCKRFEENVLNGKDKGFISFSFSGEESPFREVRENLQILKDNYNRGGRGSTAYLVEALGEYSEELLAIPDGWQPVVSIKDLDIIESSIELESDMKKYGCDPSWGINDNAAIVKRSDIAIKIVKNKLYDTKTVHKGISDDLASDYFNNNGTIAYIDNFGVGANTVEYIGKHYPDMNIKGYNIGNPINEMPFDKRRYNSFRSQQIDKFFDWVCPAEFGRKKAKLIGSRKDWGEICNMFFREEKGRKIYITKTELKNLGYASPNVLDACVHTMIDGVDLNKLRDVPIYKDGEESTSTIIYNEEQDTVLSFKDVV